MLNFKATKEFLYKKQQTQSWGTLIYVTPCVIMILLLMHHNISFLDSAAFGVLASMVVDPLLIAFTADVAFEKLLS